MQTTTSGNLKGAFMVKDVLKLWEKLDDVAHQYLTPIKNEKQYKAALSFLEELWGKVGENSKSPYASLFQIMRDHIMDYEEKNYAVPDAPPHRVLSFLLEQKNLSQQEVANEVGMYQSNLSQVLKGERKLTTEQVKKLAEYFEIEPAVLL
jgi:HTH-type transcriptional regulator / antitoxin HigA